MSDTMANPNKPSGPRVMPQNTPAKHMTDSQAAQEKQAEAVKVKRENKPRTFYMAYQGNLITEPVFVFDKDELVDMLTNNRDMQVKRITVPVGKRAKQQGAAPDKPGADAAGSPEVQT